MMEYGIAGSGPYGNAMNAAHDAGWAQSQASQQALASLAPAPEPTLRSRIRELGALLTMIDQGVSAVHSRVVPPAPTDASVNKDIEARTYEHMIERLHQCAASIHQRLGEINERV